MASLSRQPLFGLLRDESNRPKGSYLGVVPFADEGDPPMGEPIGAELDGRLFTDLSDVMPDDSVTPTEHFFIRTRASKLLDTGGWSIQVGGLGEKVVTIPVEELSKKARPMGTHLIECAGNTRAAHFGMISVATWEGVPLQEIVQTAQPKVSPARLLISGYDEYKSQSMTSTPGASWIFSQDQLFSSHAFLATKMNGQPLSVDHGAPVRLLVPGWYGCACIKWVNQIMFVAEDVPATSQMREYAGRTSQIGVPKLAGDYQPATIDTAATPVRIEKWRADGKILYRVAGIRWGSNASGQFMIRFSSDEDYVPVGRVDAVRDGRWSFWTHDWAPRRPGKFTIQLRLEPGVRDSRRLDSGYYDRSVNIAEV